MIIEYNEQGMITHIVSDPTPVGLADFMRNNDKVLIELVPDFGEGGAGVARIDIMTDYVDLTEEVIKPRPALNVPAEISISVGESFKIVGLPDPITFNLDGENIEVKGGELEIEGDMPASYSLFVNQFPYISSRIEVTVHEA